MNSIGRGILSVVGNTPLIRLDRALDDCNFNLFAKLEGLNPGGSMKDRPALGIIRKGIQTGEIDPQTVVVESSSGNMGIGLAQACRYFGLHFICVVDPKTTPQNVRLLQAYGARVELVSEPDPQTREFLPARLKRVRDLLNEFENAFWPNQYSNLENALSHHRTMDEIVRASQGQVDYLFCATSTCGTLRGCVDYIREHGMNTKVIAVDAVGSVIHGGPRGKRLLPGHGASLVPELYDPSLAHDCIHVTDFDCVVGCRRLAVREAILVGGSSGAVFMAVAKTRERVPRNSNCVLIFADRGERYLDTIYSDDWVTEHFGDVAHFWKPKIANDNRIYVTTAV
jgi:2,3-diaminopropionate biosynthesis protein SbnA